MKPKSFEKLYYKHRFYYVVRFNIMYNEVEDEWTYDEVRLPYGKFDYSTIVSSIIEFKYPADKMQAIINNYLLDNNDEESIKEFTDMQQWRKFAKTYAKELL